MLSLDWNHGYPNYVGGSESLAEREGLIALLASLRGDLKHLPAICSKLAIRSIKMHPYFKMLYLLIYWITHWSKGLGGCLQDEPNTVPDYEYPELPPGAMYNADYQCRLQFGAEAQVCSPPDEICSRLWCNVNDTCTTQLKPAAPGTHCGKHMVSETSSGVQVRQRIKAAAPNYIYITWALWIIHVN